MQVIASDILFDIWDHLRRQGQITKGSTSSPAPYLSSRVGNKWTDLQISWGATHIPIQPVEGDYYFTPNLFVSGKPRTNHWVTNPTVLFADLDKVEPKSLLLRRLMPHTAWETSPGNYQGVWYLNKPFPNVELWAQANRALTRTIGADKGGWFPAKLLRVPLSVNYKDRYGPSYPQGTLLWHEPHKRVSMRDLRPQLEINGALEPQLQSSLPPLPTVGGINYDRISERSASMLGQTVVRDRSMHIVKTINSLRKDGVSKDQIFGLIMGRNWNKWETKPTTLWREIHN